MAKTDNALNKAATGKKVLKKVCKIIFVILIAVCIVLVLFVAIDSRKGNGVTVGPYGVAVILSGSMEPSIKTGSLIIIKSVPEDRLAEGDVITYKPIEGGNVLLTHRIVSVNSAEHSFVTQGDANDTPDPDSAKYESIVGKVILAVPAMGNVVNFLKTPHGIAILILVIVLYEILWQVILKKPKKNNEGENLS